MSAWKAKRFWKSAAVDAVEGPAKNLLVVPTQAMAQAIALEWDAQEDEIKPDTMPVTKTANAALDKVALQHGEVADMLAAYGDSDLLCYRAEAPAELVARQAAEWDPMLEWAADALGARLHQRAGIMHKPQDTEALAALSARVHALDNFELAAFHDLVSLSGSLVLGFAATMNAKTTDALWDISRLDEHYQAEQWGRDDEAEALADLKKASFAHAKRMYDLAQRAADGA